MAARFETTADARRTLERWLAALTRKRESLDEVISALRKVYGQLDQVGPEVAAAWGEAALAKHGYREPAPTLLDLWEPGQSPAVGAEVVRRMPAYTGRHRERVINYFLDRGNEPASNQMIREAVGLTRGAVAVVLYASASEFEKAGADRRGKVAWRLTPHQYEEGIAERAKQTQPPVDGPGG